MIISSKTNVNYKDLLSLTTNRGRKKSERFIIEGKRELSRALKANIPILSFVFSESATKNERIAECFCSYFSQAILLSDKLFEKLSIRENPDGVMAIAKTWASDLSQCKLDPNGLYLLVESLEKPGNLGALMRSAEATRVDGFFIANPIVNIFNPNVIRASQGAVFNLETYWDTSDNLFHFFKNFTFYVPQHLKIPCYLSYSRKDKNHQKSDFQSGELTWEIRKITENLDLFSKCSEFDFYKNDILLEVPLNKH